MEPSKVLNKTIKLCFTIGFSSKVSHIGLSFHRTPSPVPGPSSYRGPSHGSSIWPPVLSTLRTGTGPSGKGHETQPSYQPSVLLKWFQGRWLPASYFHFFQHVPGVTLLPPLVRVTLVVDLTVGSAEECRLDVTWLRSSGQGGPISPVSRRQRKDLWIEIPFWELPIVCR